MAAGGAALGGFAVARNLFAGGAFDNRAAPAAGSRPAGARRYIEMERSGELTRREQALWDLYSPCRLCPRLCGANRSAGRAGICSSPGELRVASFGRAFNIDRPIAGTRGTGAVFMSNCNLLCVFCQNWQIAHRGDGAVISHTDLANIMLDLQRIGCHNISYVTPTHMVPHIVTALRIAIARGFNLPLVFNTSAYESLEMVQLLDGIVDIYMPDFKFQDAAIAARFTHGAPDYPLHAAAAIKEMHRQVGGFQTVDGIGQRGLIIVHLVMPENLAGTDVFVRWVVSELGRDTFVTIMDQYRPMFRANDFPPLDRRITAAEFAQAKRWAREAGLHNFH